MIVFSINNIIGRLHDAAIAALNKEQGGWFKRAWKRTNGLVLVNTAINEGKDGKGSVFIGGPGPFEIRASINGLFSNKDEFKKLVGIYLQHFAGDASINPSDIEVTNTHGKKVKNQLACQYKINLKTGIKWIPKEIPDEETPEEERVPSNGNQNDNSNGNSNDDSDAEILDSRKLNYHGTVLVETVGNHYKENNLWLIEASNKNKMNLNKTINNNKVTHETIEKFIDKISNENFVDAKRDLKSILKKKIQQKFEKE